MKITIDVEDGQVTCKCDKGLTLEDSIQIFTTVILGNMNDVMAQVHEDDRPRAKEVLYDAFNFAASRTLEAFAPEYEMRPTLTTQAILEAENKIIMSDRLNEVEVGS